MKVKDVMSTNVMTVDPSTSLRDVAAILIKNRFSGIPVVDADGSVLGVVSEADILLKEREPADEEDEGLIHRFLHRGHATGDADMKLSARTAGEAMTSPAVVTRPEALVSQAASLMLDRRVNRLPVVDDGKMSGPVTGGKLVGIVTRADLVRAFARPDEEIAAEMETLVSYQRGLWNLSADAITYDVKSGEVTLGGQVERRLSGRVPRRPHGAHPRRRRGHLEPGVAVRGQRRVDRPERGLLARQGGDVR